MTSTTALRDKQAMDYLFYPRSIAIIGASADPAKPGGAPLRSLISNGYAGTLYPVNPNYDHLLGLPCFPSLLHIPAEVDLALIAVPAQATMAALRECAEKGVKAVVVLTSGFGETGDLGARMQAEMTALVRSAGISLCGPNCMGIFNARNKMTAGFVITQVEEKLAVPEFFGFISQSGGFSAVMHAAALDRSLGFTYFISSGNESDLQFADYLAYMVADPATKVIGGYLEGTRDGQRLMQAAEIALDAQKPVVVIKTGKSPVSAQAAASHTGALAGDNRVYQAFFKQKGIIRADSVEELSTILTILATGNLPANNRVGLIVGSGGNGVLLADKCAEVGLEVAPMTEKTMEALHRLLPAFGAAANPIDMTSRILTDAYLIRETTRLVLQDPQIDMVIIMHWSSGIGRSQAMRGITDILTQANKPILVLVWGADDAAQDDLRFFRTHRIAAVREMDFAVSALAALAEYSAKLRSRREKPPQATLPLPNLEQAAALLKSYPPGTTLSESQAKAVLRSCSIATAKEALATTPERAVEIAAALGCPVALKIDSPDIPHKTEAGGVKLGLETPEQIRAACREISQNALAFRPDARINGILVQEMLTGGIETIVGISRDPVFGPVIMFGLGGIWVEALADVSLRIAPLEYRDAAEMVSEIKGAALLQGLRGRPIADREAVIQLLLLLSQLAITCPEIGELDLNPLLVYPQGQGVVAGDALITIR